MTYIDCDELACRIAEACIGLKRPDGATARESFDHIKRIDSHSAAGWMFAARRAAEYIAECCNANHPGSVEIKSIAIESERTQ